MDNRRIPTARLALATLALALAAGTAHAAAPRVAPAGRAAGPAGWGNLLRYSACAFGVAIASTPQGLIAAFISCSRTMYDEVNKES